MDPKGVVGLDRGDSTERYVDFRLPPKGLVYSIGRFDIEVTIGASLLAPPRKYDLAGRLQATLDLWVHGQLAVTLSKVGQTRRSIGVS